jgi:hypothetical protein
MKMAPNPLNPVWNSKGADWRPPKLRGKTPREEFQPGGDFL